MSGRKLPRPPSYWRRQLARGRIGADDPRLTPAPEPAELDARLAALGRPSQPRRIR